MCQSGKELRKFTGHSDGVSSVVFLPDGKQVLTGSWDKTARLWDAQTGKELRQFTGHSDGVTSAAISPDGKQVLTGSWDKTARLWDVPQGKELRQFIGHSDGVYAVAFSPDGKQVLTGSADKTARLWDCATAAKNSASSPAIRIGFIRWPFPRMASRCSREVGIRPRACGIRVTRK